MAVICKYLFCLQIIFMNLQCEDPMKLRNADYYNKLQCSPADCNPLLGSPPANTHFKRSDKELICVETLLCSTKLTQNGNTTGFIVSMYI